jgi:hypothetical protein
MTDSTFWHDGYRDCMEGRKPYPPGIPVLDAEYLEGYGAAYAEQETISGQTEQRSERNENI